MTPRRRMPIESASKVPAVPAADFFRYFDNFLKANRKQWAHDRTKTLGGSEVFGCIRKAWYSRHNTPKDEGYTESWGATRRGDLIENYHVVPAMEHASKSEGFKIDYTGGDQQTLFCDGVPMSVTPDGLIHGVPRDFLSRYGVPDLKGDCCMLEIKSIDPRVDLSEEKAIHHGQTQIQMGLVRENTAFRPMFAVILYIDASFFDNINVFVVEFDAKKYEVAKKRARLVYDCTDPGTLMREGKIDDSCKYCPFTEACMGTTVKAFPTDKPKPKGKKAVSDPALVADLEALVMEGRRIRHEKKTILKKDELIKEQIKEALRAHDSRWAKDQNWSVSYSMASGKETLNKDAITAALAEINQLIIDKGLATEVNDILKGLGLGEEGQNEPRELVLDTFMSQGNPYEILRLTYTEPESEDL